MEVKHLQLAPHHAKTQCKLSLFLCQQFITNYFDKIMIELH